MRMRERLRRKLNVSVIRFPQDEIQVGIVIHTTLTRKRAGFVNRITGLIAIMQNIYTA
jgi:hypothetical protein